MSRTAGTRPGPVATRGQVGGQHGKLAGHGPAAAQTHAGIRPAVLRRLRRGTLIRRAYLLVTHGSALSSLLAW